MARLLAIVSRAPIDIALSIGQPQHISMATHGWGIAWHDQNKIHTRKGVRSAVDMTKNSPVHLSIKTTHCILHLRQATSGTISEQNTHPFSYENYAFAHMGSVNKELLLKHLTTPYNNNFQSEPIDSEVYFRLLLQHMQSEKDPARALHYVTNLINSTKGANFLMMDTQSLYAYRYGLDLYWMRWNHDTALSVESASGVSLISNQIASQPAYIISSDKSIEGNWNAFDDGEMFTVDKNLHYTLKNILN